MAENNINMENQELQTEENLSEVLQIRRDKLAALRESNMDPFTITKYDVTEYAKNIVDNFETMENQVVSLAGRIMSRRIMGKASFFDIQDTTGRIQVYMNMKLVGQETYEQFKKWDIGDIVGLGGEVFRTQHGEISIRCNSITLLSKSLLPLP